MEKDDESDLIAWLEGRDEWRRRNWGIALIVAVLLGTGGFVVGKTINDNADERRERQERVDRYLCALSGRDCDDD
jgi:hypothetical protein